MPKLENPYLEEFQAFDPKSARGSVWGKLDLCLKYAWGVPTDQAIERIASYAPLIEIGAGAGYWAWCLRQFGAEIVAFDVEVNPSGENKRRSKKEVHLTEVLQGDENKIGDYPNHTLFLCYPPSKYPPLAIECLRRYRGEYLIYVGPPWRSHEAAGDIWFHAALANLWAVVETISIPSPADAGDQVFVYRQLPPDQHRIVLTPEEVDYWRASQVSF